MGSDSSTERWSLIRDRRLALLGVLMLGTLGVVFSVEPIPQPLSYHDFADQRRFLGTPNALNVWSNLPFLLVGLAGLAYCRKRTPWATRSWTVFFAGVALVSLGSAYYHWAPSNATLAWDRLPMSAAFMSVLVAVLTLAIRADLERRLLLPAVAIGAVSVLYWHAFDDLRLYAWVQFLPLLCIPVVLAWTRPKAIRYPWLFAALALYGLAKAFEYYDARVYALTGELVSGHSLKHLSAAAGAACALVMLRPSPRARRAA